MTTIDEEIERYERECKENHASYLSYVELCELNTDFTDKNYMAQMSNHFFMMYDLKRGFVETLKKLRDGQ